ncbi:MAG: hypothetical protein QW261_15475 [Candidatus Jordarchaeaceae archaeon]
MYEHCIENMPLTMERTGESCPLFGHNCPGGEEQVAACERIEDTLWNRVIVRVKKD